MHGTDGTSVSSASATMDELRRESFQALLNVRHGKASFIPELRETELRKVARYIDALEKAKLVSPLDTSLSREEEARNLLRRVLAHLDDGDFNNPGAFGELINDVRAFLR